MIKSEAIRLWGKYFSDSAHEDIKITLEVVLKIRWHSRIHADETNGGAKVVNNDVEMYESAVGASGALLDIQQYLLTQMNVDYYTFLASEKCRECLSELEDEESLRQALLKSRMI